MRGRSRLLQRLWRYGSNCRRGTYELARERRRITAASVLRAVSSENGGGEPPHCRLVKQLVAPIVEAAGKAFLDELDTITIDDICRRAEDLKLGDEKNAGADFTI
jgi:Rrf2 family iron-sulfur cluster assembly transcriptional regulator